MKKNVKYLGAAAAALLAVAPVVASTTVASADTVSVNGEAVKPGKEDPKAPVINIKGAMSAQPTSTSVKDLLTDSAVRKAVSISGASIVGVGSSAISNLEKGGEYQTSLQAGKTYYLQTSVALGGLKANTDYTIKMNNLTIPVKSNQNGVIENVYVAVAFNAYDAAIQGQPYFVDNSNGVNLNNGAFANTYAHFVPGTSTVQDIENAAKAVVTPYVNRNGQTAKLNYYFGDIASQLSNQGVSFVNNKVASSARSFYVTVTTVNPDNNKTATAKIQFSVNNDQDYLKYPAIYQGKETNIVKQDGSNKYKGISDVTVVQNSDDAKNFAKNPIGYLNLGAWTVQPTTAVPNPGHVDLKVLSNKIDPAKSGIYPVSLSATNPNGYTTTLNFNVIVTPNGSRTATIKYKAGYGVNVWNVLSNSSVAFTGTRIMDGQTVTINGEKTVNGVKYYKIGDGQYVQAQYIDGAASVTPSKPATKPSTSSKEEAMSGVIVVKYDGRGKVALVDQNGHYGTGNYVAKNAAFKVFAKKTINGKTYYRLGTQSQWIPAQYAMFR